MPSTVDISHVREQILFHTSTAVGVIRDGKTMKNSLQQLSSLCTELKEASYSYEAMRLYNDAITAYLVISSAYERKGSVGCHFRTDSIDEPEKYRIVIHLHYVEGYKAWEIASVIGITEAAVKKRLQRGREALREIYEKEAR